MAVYKQNIVDIELTSGNVHRSFLKHSIGTADSAADHFGVRVFRNGVAEDLTNVSVQGYFRDPRGNNIAITSGNSVEGNVAEFVLPQACYNYEGPFTLSIKLIGGGVTGTMRIVDGMIDNTNTGSAVAPTETVPTYQEVLAVYGDMVETLEDYDEVVADQNGQITKLKGIVLTPTRNLFDMDSLIFPVGANGYVSATAKQFADNYYASPGITSGITFEENTQYTITLTAYANSSSTGNGLKLVIHYTDGSSNTELVYGNGVTAPSTRSVTSKEGKTISYIGFSYNSGPSKEWNVAEIQIEKGTNRTEYIQPYVANDITARDEIKDIKQSFTGEDSFVNGLHGYVNYGYDEPAHLRQEPGATNSTAYGIDRINKLVTINGGGISENTRIKINGQVERTIAAETVKNWPTTFQLLSGHIYEFTIEYISGTITSALEGIPWSCSVYKSGNDTTSGSGRRTEDGKKYIRRVTGDGSYYNFVIFLLPGYTFTDVKFLCYVKDLSLEDSGDFDYFNSIINEQHRLIDYGYGNKKTELQQDSTATDGTAVGVERFGTRIKLNYAGSSYVKRVRISGEITRASGQSTYKSWIGNLQLTQGREYRFIIRKIAGTGTLDNAAYIPSLVVYESEGASSIATAISSSETFSEYSFIAPAGPVTLAIYIAAAAVLTNLECSVTLGEPSAESDDIAEYYIDEMADTIAKVRNESTSPALVFLWSTDNHRHSNNADGVQNFGNMIKNMKALAKQIKCDFGLCTGDLTDGDKTQAVTLGRAYDCMTGFMSIGIPHVWSQGNHDTNYAVSGQPYLFTLVECYKAYFTATKGMTFNAAEYGTDFYIDFDNLGVRFISLNANNVNSGHVEYAYGDSTAQWLAGALDTDRTVILAVHQSPIRDQVYGRTSTTGSTAIVNALSAFTGNGGNLIMISGHSHFDGAWVSPWVSIAQDCQRFSSVAEDITNDAHETSGYIDVIRKNARAQYTASEDLWSVCIYKPISNEFSMIRFGAGKDRYFHVTPIAPQTVATKLTGTISWTSSDASVATVSNGTITRTGAGRCAILAKDASGNYECWIVENS